MVTARSGCRGAIIVSRPGWSAANVAWAARTSVSSPECVRPAATPAGRSGQPESRQFHRVHRPWRRGQFQVARFAHVAAAQRAQPFSRRSRCAAHAGQTAQHRPCQPGHAAPACQAAVDRRALISITGMRRARQAASRLGHSSLSTKPAAVGRQCSRNRAAQAGTSRGATGAAHAPRDLAPAAAPAASPTSPSGAEQDRDVWRGLRQCRQHRKDRHGFAHRGGMKPDQPARRARHRVDARGAPLAVRVVPCRASRVPAAIAAARAPLPSPPPPMPRPAEIQPGTNLSARSAAAVNAAVIAGTTSCQASRLTGMAGRAHHHAAAERLRHHHAGPRCATPTVVVCAAHGTPARRTARQAVPRRLQRRDGGRAGRPG